MGLGIKRRLRQLLTPEPLGSSTLDGLLATQPASIVAQARNAHSERRLTDQCLAILKEVGSLPEPTNAGKRYLDTPEEKRRPLTAFGGAMADIRKQVQTYRECYAGPGKPVFLDVGGNKGECRAIAEGFAYWLVDLTPRTEDADRVIQADICKPLPVEPASVDIVFSNQVWEHLREPWKACEALGALLKPGGLFVTNTLFAYRYHPLPEDFYRYTHVGLAALHEDYANTVTVLCNYDTSIRRLDQRGGNHTLGADMPPVDWLGGWRENWYVYYIGRKKSVRLETENSSAS